MDQETPQRLKRLAARWQVSQAEVVRRSLEKAEKTEAAPLAIEERIGAARRLRTSLWKRKIDVEAWIRAARDSRC